MANGSLRVFVALEGGGAKGLVHIGALKALEEHSAIFCGLAGTSAGAIIAALKAAGFGADDLVNPTLRTTLLSEVDPNFRSATDFFGRSAWARISLFRKVLGQLSSGRLKFWVAAIAVLVAGIVALTAVLWGHWAAIVAVLVFGLLSYIFYYVIIGGLASVKVFRDTLGRVLQRKMFPSEENRTVSFSDFGNDRYPSLKIVATNLTRGELRLFSPEETPDVAVADAVAASICLPLIFRAWDIAGSLHFDGGLVSNLPAWTFDEERALDQDATTIAIEIVAASTAETPPTVRRWLVPAIRTAIFGSSILNKRGVGRFEAVALNTDLDLLAFDAGGDKIFQVVSDATKAARVRIVQRLFTEPQIFRNACSTVRDQVGRLLAEEAILLGGAPFQGRIRVALAVRDEGHRKSLRLKYAVGFDTDSDTDEELLLPISGSHVGEAFTEQEATFAYFRLPGAATLPPGERPPTIGLDRRRQRLVRRDMAWLLCIPVSMSEPVGPAWKSFVVIVDCDQAIDPEADKLPEVLDLLESEIITIFKQAVLNLEGAS